VIMGKGCTSLRVTFDLITRLRVASASKVHFAPQPPPPLSGPARMLLVCSCLVLAVVTVAAARPIRPVYDVSRLPVFFHSSNSSGPFNAAAITEMAKFPMVTVEKFQGTCWQRKDPTGCNQTDIIVQQLARVKALKPSVATIVYFNSAIDFPQYRVHQKLLANPSWRLRTSDGTVVKIKGDHIDGAWSFDYLNSAMAGALVEECARVVQMGLADGCFQDRAIDGLPRLPNATHATLWQVAHLKTLATMQDQVRPGFVIGNHGYDERGTDAVMVESCANNDDGLKWLNESISAGKIVQCHVSLRIGCGCAPGCKDRDSTLAMFLALMPPTGSASTAYFGCGPWLDDGSDLSANGWQEDYDFPLGEPLSAAAMSGDGILRRSFASGTQVEYNTVSHEGQVTWAK